MNKLDRYDAQELLKARKIVDKTRDYNYTSDSDPLYRKLSTIVNKIDAILNKELEPRLQEEYDLLGKI